MRWMRMLWSREVERELERSKEDGMDEWGGR
jgi:hypothetical protein